MGKPQRVPESISTATADAWSYVVLQPARVVVYEDTARKGMLTLRWREEGNWKRRTLGKRLLRTTNGEPSTEQVSWAIGEAMKRALELAGQIPESAASAPSTSFRPCTIGDAWDVITDAETGRYRQDSDHRREIKRALTAAETIWGKARPWATLEDEDWLRLMRRTLEDLVRRGCSGVRRTEIVVSRLATVTNLLRARKRIPRDAGFPPDEWKATIRDDWRGLTGARSDYEPRRPRHTLEEMRRLLVSVLKPETDPRFRLLFALGAEYRLGQVRRAMRSDLDLDARTLVIRGAGRKKGETVELTDGQLAIARAAIDEYLAPLEALHLASELPDYPLFPAGRMRGINAPRLKKLSPRFGKGMRLTTYVSEEWVIDQFHAAERSAEPPIENAPGRAAYGVRRVALDATLDPGIIGGAISERALMAAGGWSDVKIPHSVYAEKENRAGRREAKEARAKVRGEASPYTGRTQDGNAAVRDGGEPADQQRGKANATK